MANKEIFERVEKKYRMDQEQYQKFLKGVAGKIHADQYGLHTIRNIYYDTDDFGLIRNSLEKPKYKEKFRVRGYGEINEDSEIFLEIKKKFDGVVYKRRVALPMEQAKDFLEKGILPENSSQIMREIDYFMRFYHPTPKVYLAYDRIAYVGDEDPELRITIDRNIRSRMHRLDLSYDGECRILNPDSYLMEIKVPMAYPVWLADLLCELEIYPVSFSKYGTLYGKALSEGIILPENEGKCEESNIEEENKICLPVYSVV